MIKKNRISFLFLPLLLVLASGCGNDNSTGPEAGDPPTMPDLEVVEPDLSFFQNNSPQQAAKESRQETFTNYYHAHQTAAGITMFMSVASYSLFFNEAETEDADYQDGIWVWTYTSAAYEGGTVELKTTAEEQSNGYVNWAMYWSVDNGEVRIDDYKMLEGSVSEDGSQGDWTFNSLNPESNQEVPAIVSSWTVSSETEKELTLELFSEGELEYTIRYEEDAPEYSMRYSGSQEDEIFISWNTETNMGSIIEGDTQSCWNSNFEDVECD